MAEKKNKLAAEAQAGGKQTAGMQMKYSKEELARASEGLFQVKPECVIAALLMAGVEEATEEEAKEIIQAFMRKEVR